MVHMKCMYYHKFEANIYVLYYFVWSSYIYEIKIHGTNEIYVLPQVLNKIIADHSHGMEGDCDVDALYAISRWPA